MGLKRIQTNPTGIAYYEGSYPFLNWWRAAGGPTVTRSAGGNLADKACFDNGYLDATTGEVVSPAPSNMLSVSRPIFSPSTSFQVAAGCDYGLEQFFAEFDGTGTVSTSGLGAGGVAPAIVGGNPNKWAFTFGDPQPTINLIFNVTNVNDPPRNIRVYQARYAARVAAGKILAPEWSAELANFGRLRFMPVQSINNCGIKNFSQLADLNYTWWGQTWDDGTQTSGSSAGSGSNGAASGQGGKGGLGPDVICAMANEAGWTSIHVNFPVGSSDALVTSFLTYMKAHYSGHVTLEFSNECWHFGFNQARSCEQQGAPIFGKHVTNAVGTNSTTITLTVPSHGLSNGANVTVYLNDPNWNIRNLNAPCFPASGYIATVVDANTITIPTNANGMSYDPTGFGAFTGAGNNYICTGNIYDEWYGYRAAAIMNIARGIYADATRWTGIINTQAVSTAHYAFQMAGVTRYIADNSLGIAENVLVQEVHSAPYFPGDNNMPTAYVVSGVAKTNPARVYAPGHPFVNGDTVRYFFTTGATTRNNLNATVANVSGSYFDMQGVDLSATVGYSLNTTLAGNVTTGQNNTIPVASLSGISSGDIIGITLNNAAVHWTTVGFISPGNVINLAVGPPSAANSGNAVVIYAGFSADTTLSAGAAANATSLSVTSISGMANGANIGILLDSGAFFWTTISGAPSAGTVNLGTALPSTAANGKRVLVYPVGNNYCGKSFFWDLADKSATLHGSDPVTYPTIYTYFNQQMKKAIITGSCDEPGIVFSLTINSYVGIYVPALIAAAAAFGMTVSQYEGGAALVGDGVMQGVGAGSSYEQLYYQCAVSQEMADLYTLHFKKMIALGVKLPSKFVPDGAISRFGAWGTIQYWPTTKNGGTSDLNNPVWLAIKAIRDNKTPDTWAMKFGT